MFKCLKVGNVIIMDLQKYVLENFEKLGIVNQDTNYLLENDQKFIFGLIGEAFEMDIINKKTMTFLRYYIHGYQFLWSPKSPQICG